jgi:hypothetical protein
MQAYIYKYVHLYIPTYICAFTTCVIGDEILNPAGRIEQQSQRIYGSCTYER